MDRRAFVNRSCLACAAVAGGSSLLALLESCSSLPVVMADAGSATIIVPLSRFQEGPVIIVRRKEESSDIFLVRHSDTEFSALEMTCTHQQQPLTATSTGLYCPSHGSRFGLYGEVLHEPATEPLRQFTTNLQADHIEISHH